MGNLLEDKRLLKDGTILQRYRAKIKGSAMDLIAKMGRTHPRIWTAPPDGSEPVETEVCKLDQLKVVGMNESVIYTEKYSSMARA